LKIVRLNQPKSIAGRLLLFSGLFVTAALVVASVILWLALKNVVREQIDQRLDTQIGALAGAVTRLPDGGLSLSTAVDPPPFDRVGSGWYWRIDADEKRLTSRSLMQNSIDAPPARQDFRHMFTGMASPGESKDSQGKALYTRQAIRSIGGVMMTFTATAPIGALNDPAVRALSWLIPCMLLLGVVLLAGTLWQIRFGLRPLSHMVGDIDAINRGELARLPPQQTPELAPLSLKTNALILSNEERLTATRMQFANLAHGLKTPVASLLLALDDGNDPDGSLRKLSRRIDQRIKHHLSAARHAMASSGSAASTSVSASVTDLHLAIGSIHAEKRIAFETDIDAALKVACDESDVEEMLGNLMDNAFKWASSRVSVTARRQEAFVRITVADDGPGIAKDRLDAVLLPGIREDERVPGSGFGLTIVKELAELYGGALLLEPASPTGLLATINLPASVQSSSRPSRSR
jgi:signal transduction histidine kinase